MAKQSPTELYNHYHRTLLYCLPMNNNEFQLQLRQCDLLPEDISTTLESLTLRAEKASYFLDNVITPSLADRNDACFCKLLTSMAQSNVEDVVRLAEEMKAKLDVVSQTPVQCE